jgi:hypothetical protein
MRSILTACRARWKRLSPLTRDVTLILLFKVAALVIGGFLHRARSLQDAPRRSGRRSAPPPRQGAADTSAEVVDLSGCSSPRRRSPLHLRPLTLGLS